MVGGSLDDLEGAVVGPDVTSVAVTLGDPGTLRASYVVSCSGINSPKSTALSLTITDPNAPEEPDSEDAPAE